MLPSTTKLSPSVEVEAELIVKTSLADNGEAIIEQPGELITIELIRYKVEGAELVPVPAVRLLDKHACGDR